MKKIKTGSNKNFGIVFFIFFLILSIYPILYDGSITIWLFIISLIFLILGMFNSKYLTPLNILWFKFGILLGKLISPVIMILIFFGIVTPIAIIMRLLKKDLLNLKFTNDETYWINKSGPKSKMKNQF